MKDYQDSISRLKKEQMERENGLLSQLMENATSGKDLKTFEADLAARKNEILFKVNNEVEDCKVALKDAEDLVSRLKKHLVQLQNMGRILTR